MKPWTTWLFGLGLSGALTLGLAGCGGGDVPDPSSDELAATEEGGEPEADPTMAPPAIPGPAAPAPAGDAAPAAPGPGPAAPGPAPAPAPGGEAAATPAADAPPQAAAGGDAQAAKSDTAELLAMGAGATAPASSVADAPPADPNAPGGAPGSPGLAPGAPGSEPDAGQLANPAAMNGPGNPIGPVGPGGPGGEGDSSLGSAGPGGLGGPGGASELKPGDTNSPHGAVNAFLYALAHKDRDRLAEATALRASTVEEGGKYVELFSRILDTSISDDELNDLATRLEGFRDAGENKVKSTGRLGVTIRKSLKDGGWLQRTVTVRKEKKGWGVLDISGATEFDNARSTRNQRRP